MPELVIVTGMSGAGRTEAMNLFEDLGYFCVDNLPASLIGNLFELRRLAGQPDEKCRIAVVCDARNRTSSARLADELNKSTGGHRLPHPVFGRGRREAHRALQVHPPPLTPVRRRHDHRTGHRARAQPSVWRARERASRHRHHCHAAAAAALTIRELFAPGRSGGAVRHRVLVRLQARRAPLTPTWLWTCASCRTPTTNRRCAPSRARQARPRLRDVPPRDHRVPEEVAGASRLRHARLRGRRQTAAGHRLERTGGQHRSVALAESTADYLKAKGYRVSIAHRDLSLAEGADASARSGAAAGR